MMVIVMFTRLLRNWRKSIQPCFSGSSCLTILAWDRLATLSPLLNRVELNTDGEPQVTLAEDFAFVYRLRLHPNSSWKKTMEGLEDPSAVFHPTCRESSIHLPGRPVFSNQDINFRHRKLADTILKGKLISQSSPPPSENNVSASSVPCRKAPLKSHR